MTGELTGYLVSEDIARCGPVQVRNRPEDYYQLLNCRIIQVLRCRIGKDRIPYYVVCDEDGKIRRKRPTAFTDDRRGFLPALVGDILIIRRTEEGLASLTPEDVDYCHRSVETVTDSQGNPLKMLEVAF